jgi:UDPglucose--hexose-1-phosphate uridylyltransferase
VEAPTKEELETCPFDAGREDRTPPETLTIGDPWRIRVVPNLYPAFDRQEVVVHSPEHVRSIADLRDDQLDLVAEAWQRRRAAEPGGYVHALINEGRVAGGSLAHSHSQLVWLADTPPAVTTERDLASALGAEKVLEQDGIVAVCPRAGRVPYEALIAPADPEDDPWTSGRLAPALRTLAELVRRLHALGGSVPLNAWLHAGPWWHIELFPRLTVLAGIELGAGIYVNTVPPEEAAATLRDAKGRP